MQLFCCSVQPQFPLFCRKRAKASVLTIYFLVRFCYYTPINSLSQLSQKKHITSPCKHVEQHHIWGDKTRAAYMRFGYVIDKRNHLCLRLINVTYNFQHFELNDEFMRNYWDQLRQNTIMYLVYLIIISSNLKAYMYVRIKSCLTVSEFWFV